VEGIFDGRGVVHVYLLARVIILDFEIIPWRIYFECAVSRIQSSSHILILCPYRFLSVPPLLPPPVRPSPPPTKKRAKDFALSLYGVNSRRKYRVHCELLFHSENLWKYKDRLSDLRKGLRRSPLAGVCGWDFIKLDRMFSV